MDMKIDISWENIVGLLQNPCGRLVTTRRSWTNLHEVASAFFTGNIGVLHWSLFQLTLV